MNQPLHLDDYLSYLEQNPDVSAVTHFRCGGARGKRPALHNSLPSGDCFLYPQFLVFLTGSKSGVGWRTGFLNTWDAFAGDITLTRWALDPKNIVLDIAKSINNYLNPEQLDKLLTNPHSIFVPLDKLRRVETGRDWTQGNYIILHTEDGDVVLAESLADFPNPVGDLLKGRKPSFVTPKYLFNKTKGYITGEWQPQAVATLKESISI